MDDLIIDPAALAERDRLLRIWRRYEVCAIILGHVGLAAICASFVATSVDRSSTLFWAPIAWAGAVAGVCAVCLTAMLHHLFGGRVERLGGTLPASLLDGYAVPDRANGAALWEAASCESRARELDRITAAEHVPPSMAARVEAARAEAAELRAQALLALDSAERIGPGDPGDGLLKQAMEAGGSRRDGGRSDRPAY